MPAIVVKMDSHGIEQAARFVKKGGLIVYPTDTVYGLGCDPFDTKSVARLFEAKARGSKPIPILCENLLKASNIVRLNAVALSLARRNWPGALTIIAPRIREVPRQVDQGTGEVGVRVPAMAKCLKLIMLCGGYLAGTSANLSGRPSCQTAEDAIGILGKKVDLILDGGRTKGEASTVVRMRGNTVEVLREGPVRIPNGYRRV
jgi:L-threonylcarbamoyladenylate synthase